MRKPTDHLLATGAQGRQTVDPAPGEGDDMISPVLAGLRSASFIPHSDRVVDLRAT